MSLVRGNRKQRRKQDSQPAGLSPRERIWIVSLVAGSFLLTAGLIWFELNLNREFRLRPRLEKWRLEYHLSEEMVQAIRTEEEQYHGIANRLSGQKRTRAEADAHVFAISHFMSPEDGARFRVAHIKGRDDRPVQRASSASDSLLREDGSP